MNGFSQKLENWRRDRYLQKADNRDNVPVTELWTPKYSHSIRNSNTKASIRDRSKFIPMPGLSTGSEDVFMIKKGGEDFLPNISQTPTKRYF